MRSIIKITIWNSPTRPDPKGLEDLWGLMEIEDKKISQAFSNFFNAYAKAINKKYDLKGSLFERKFKRKRVDTEDYLRKLTVNINLNSVIHGFCEDYKKYRHS